MVVPSSRPSNNNNRSTSTGNRGSNHHLAATSLFPTSMFDSVDSTSISGLPTNSTNKTNYPRLQNYTNKVLAEVWNHLVELGEHVGRVPLCVQETSQCVEESTNEALFYTMNSFEHGATSQILLQIQEQEEDEQRDSSSSSNQHQQQEQQREPYTAGATKATTFDEVFETVESNLCAQPSEPHDGLVSKGSLLEREGGLIDQYFESIEATACQGGGTGGGRNPIICCHVQAHPQSPHRVKSFPSPRSSSPPIITSQPQKQQQQQQQVPKVSAIWSNGESGETMKKMVESIDYKPCQGGGDGENNPLVLLSCPGVQQQPPREQSSQPQPQREPQPQPRPNFVKKFPKPKAWGFFHHRSKASSISSLPPADDDIRSRSSRCSGKNNDHENTDSQQQQQQQQQQNLVAMEKEESANTNNPSSGSQHEPKQNLERTIKDDEISSSSSSLIPRKLKSATAVVCGIDDDMIEFVKYNAVACQKESSQLISCPDVSIQPHARKPNLVKSFPSPKTTTTSRRGFFQRKGISHNNSNKNSAPTTKNLPPSAVPVVNTKKCSQDEEQKLNPIPTPKKDENAENEVLKSSHIEMKKVRDKEDEMNNASMPSSSSSPVSPLEVNNQVTSEANDVKEETDNDKDPKSNETNLSPNHDEANRKKPSNSSRTREIQEFFEQKNLKVKNQNAMKKSFGIDIHNNITTKEGTTNKKAGHDQQQRRPMPNIDETDRETMVETRGREERSVFVVVQGEEEEKSARDRTTIISNDDTSVKKDRVQETNSVSSIRKLETKIREGKSIKAEQDCDTTTESESRKQNRRSKDMKNSVAKSKDESCNSGERTGKQNDAKSYDKNMETFEKYLKSVDDGDDTQGAKKQHKRGSIKPKETTMAGSNHTRSVNDDTKRAKLPQNQGRSAVLNETNKEGLNDNVHKGGTTKSRKESGSVSGSVHSRQSSSSGKETGRKKTPEQDTQQPSLDGKKSIKSKAGSILHGTKSNTAIKKVHPNKTDEKGSKKIPKDRKTKSRDKDEERRRRRDESNSQGGVKAEEDDPVYPRVALQGIKRALAKNPLNWGKKKNKDKVKWMATTATNGKTALPEAKEKRSNQRDKKAGKDGTTVRGIPSNANEGSMKSKGSQKSQIKEGKWRLFTGVDDDALSAKEMRAKTSFGINDLRDMPTTEDRPVIVSRKTEKNPYNNPYHGDETASLDVGGSFLSDDGSVYSATQCDHTVLSALTAEVDKFEHPEGQDKYHTLAEEQPLRRDVSLFDSCSVSTHQTHSTASHRSPPSISSTVHSNNSSKRSTAKKSKDGQQKQDQKGLSGAKSSTASIQSKQSKQSTTSIQSKQSKQSNRSRQSGSKKAIVSNDSSIRSSSSSKKSNTRRSSNSNSAAATAAAVTAKQQQKQQHKQSDCRSTIAVKTVSSEESRESISYGLSTLPTEEESRT